MNTPPLAPPSGSQLPTDPQRAPLDPEERTIAEAMQDLPASAPSSELDARILAMARSALKHAPPMPQRMRKAQQESHRPSGLWWLGTAAGAVMAAGIGWQLGGYSDRTEGSAGPSTTVTPAADTAAADDLEILIIPRSARDATPPPPAAIAPVAAPSRPADGEGPRRRQTPASDASTPPDLQHAASEAVTSPPPPPAAPVREVLSQPAPPAAAQAEAARAEANPAQPRLDRIEVTGSRLRLGEEFPPVSKDFQLAPEDWLQRIRDRRDSGDVESARRSIREFMHAHPQRVVPRDLRQLLNESR